MKKNNISQSDIELFLKSKTFVLYGVSKDKNKFGNAILKELVTRGYNVFPIHPELESVNETICYKNLSEIPNTPDASIIAMNPSNTLKVMKEINEFNIKSVWIQRRSESEEVLKYCKENNMNAIYGYCIIMFLEPQAFFHKIHKWFLKLSGLPKQ